MEQEIEIWKPLEDFENYHVSTLSRIKNAKTDYILKPNLKKSGYYDVVLPVWRKDKDGKERNSSKTFRLHRLIAKAFIPNPENKCCVNHIDGNPSNSSLSNLEWVTMKENTRHAILRGSYKTGMHKIVIKTVKEIQKEHNFVLAEDLIKHLEEMPNKLKETVPPSGIRWGHKI